jgi:outer membrane murein-binding lipoprotein Lpp
MFFSVAMLILMGGIGFYAGYSAGRGDLTEIKNEMKILAAAGGSPESAAAISKMLKEAGGESSAKVDLTPVIEEVRAMAAQISRLEETTANMAPGAVAGGGEGDGKLRAELAALKKRYSAATNDYNSCKQNLSLLQVKVETLGNNQRRTSASPASAARGGNNSVVLFDNVLLKRNRNKVYNDVDVALSLRSVTSKSAKVTVNRQRVDIAFGERKLFQHGDVTCELQLMETDLNANQAKLSIACKR